MSATAVLQAAALPAPKVDLERSEAYESMRAAVAKLDAAGEDVDWRAVEATSRRVLCELGQDLRAAAYWTHARHVLGGPADLAAGLALVASLLADFWANMSPSIGRLRARTGALRWLVDRTEAYLAAYSPPLTQDAAAQLLAAVEALSSTARHRLGEQAPAFVGLQRRVTQLIAGEAEPGRAGRNARASDVPSGSPTTLLAADPQASADAAFDGPAAPARATPVRSDVTAARDAAPATTPTILGPAASAAPSPLPTLSALGRQLCAVAAERRRANAADPEAYRLLRTGLWLHLDEPPAAVAGRTRIAPLSTELRTELEQRVEACAWATLLERVESLALHHRLCLDLQRWAFQALTGLGAPYRACLVAVKLQVRALLARLPVLVQLQTRDGQPLADASTRRWLNEPEAASKPTAAGPGGDTGLGFVPSASPRGRARPQKVKLASRVGGEGEASPRSDFLGLLGRADACLAAGQQRVASLLFEDLYARLRRRRLMAWEPRLTKRVLRGMLQCSDVGQAKNARVRGALRRLAVLDLASAIELAENIHDP